MDTVAITGRSSSRGERDEAPMLYIGEKSRMVHGEEHHRAKAGALCGGRHRRGSARGHQFVRDGVAQRHRRAGRSSAEACCTRQISTWRNGGRPELEKTMSSGRVGGGQPEAIARCLGRSVDDLVVISARASAAREAHRGSRATGARIQLIGDGDLSAGIAAAVVGSGVHAVMARPVPGRACDGRRMPLPERRNLRAPGRPPSPSTRSAAARWGSPTSRRCTAPKISRAASK